MSIKHALVLLTAVFIAQPLFADEVMNSHDKSCMAIAKSCLQAGYTNKGSVGKQFWKDCMKPVLLGKTVVGVTVDPKGVQDCRTTKINEMEQELSELKEVK